MFFFVDIHECELGPGHHDCVEPAESCLNTPGSYMCVCNQGYEKDENEDCAGQFSFNNPLLHAFYKKAAIAFSLENSNDSGGSVCGGGGVVVRETHSQSM